MADTKLSALTALAGTATAPGDLLYVADVSATTSKSLRADGALLGITNATVLPSGAVVPNGVLVQLAAGTAAPIASMTVTRPAHTALTASTEYSDVVVSAATQQFATGALTTQRSVKLLAPTYGAVGASTITTAANLYVEKPIAGTNATLTRSYAIDAQDSRVQGTLTVMQSGGTAGTNQIELNHDGGSAHVTARGNAGGFSFESEGGNFFQFGTSAATYAQISTGTVILRSDKQIGWSATTNTNTGNDTALARAAAKVVKLTDGSTGSGTLSSIPVTPSQITSNQDDYAPTAGARTYRLSSDAARNITGLVAGVDGQETSFVNVGSFPITLKHATTSTAANQFSCVGAVDVVLGAGEWARLLYDATTTKWRVGKVRSDSGEGTLIVRQSGGVAGTDELQISHDGAKAIISCSDGTIKISPSVDSAVWTPFNRPLLVQCDASGGNATVALAAVADSQQYSVKVRNDGVYAWASSSSAEVANIGDTGLKRVAAGVVGVVGSTYSSVAWIQNTGAESRVTGSNVTNATNTMANVTGLSSTVIAGRKYRGRMTIFCSTDQAAEGIKFDFDGGAATWTSFQAAVVSNVQGATAGVTVSAAIATDLTFTALNGTGVNCIEIAFAGVCNAGGTFIPRVSQVAHASGTATVLVDSHMVLGDVP